MQNPKNFTASTIAPILKTIAKLTFSKEGWNHNHVIPLFIYCIEMDRVCKEVHAWYDSDILSSILVDILLIINYTPPPTTPENCNFIFFAVIRFIINILYYL